MSLYQILITHNRTWSEREIVCFCLLFIIISVVGGYLYNYDRIVLSQVVAGLLLLVFLGVVFGSTVFTRMPKERKYELRPFWSWGVVFVNHSWRMFREILLNCVLLLPLGLLLPVMLNRKVRWWKGLLVGVFVSAVIETCQLVLGRGLFEWDDMIHNGIGCMVGCVGMNIVMRWRERRRGRLDRA